MSVHALAVSEKKKDKENPQMLRTTKREEGAGER